MKYLIIMICPQCGTENPADAAFCGKCGRNLAPAPTQQSATYDRPKKFIRCSDDQKIAGVCAGIARYFDLDVNLVRTITVISFLFTASATFWAYIIMWIMIPEEPCGGI